MTERQAPAAHRSLAVLIGCALSVAGAGAAAGQVPVQGLTLADALRMAESRSETVAIARAGLTRAEGEQLRARSEYFPQVFADLSYVRTLESEFASGFGGDGAQTGAPTEECPTFTANPALPEAERIGSLERALQCFSNADPFAAFSSLDLPFGRSHRYSLDLSASQTAFSGGRVQAQVRMARAGRTSAEIALESARAELALEVAQAYWDAQLADRLLQIAEATLALSESTLAEVRLAHELGEEAEFDLLRAQVTRDTQRPVVIQRRAEREAAHRQLRRLVGAPLDAPLALATPLESVPTTPVASLLPADLPVPADTAADARAPVRQLEEAVRVQEGQRDVARAQRLPTVSLSTAWSRVSYPSNGLPSLNDLRPNWTVTARVSLPLFTGGRITGDERVAQGALDEAQARLGLTRELAAVDTRAALDQLGAAEAALEASSGTVEQAQKAYDISRIRFVEGIGTQLEVTDASILLEQAGANRALAARNLQVARLRVALLPLLPLGMNSGLAGAPATPADTPTTGIRSREQQPTRQTGTGGGFSGGGLAIPGGGG
jgi:outer membrane protein TolC